MKIALATQAKVHPSASDDDVYVKTLREAGLHVESIAWDDPAVDWSTYDAVQIRTTWNYCDDLQKFLGWCERVERETKLFNSSALVRWNAHKGYLREVKAAGIAVVPTQWINADSDVDLADALAQWGTRRGFLKPCVGANASGTMRFSLDAQDRVPDRAMDHLRQWSAHQEVMLQPYLTRVEKDGEMTLIMIDGQLSHGVRKIPKAGDYRVQDGHGAHDRPETPTRAQREIAQRCLALVSKLSLMDKAPLYARIDLMVGDSGEDLVGEIEMIEPNLFFRHDVSAARRLANALIGYL